MPSCSVPTVPSRPISFQSRGQPAGHVQAAYRIDRRELIRRPLWGDVQDRTRLRVMSTPLTGRCRGRRARSLRHCCCVPLGSGSGERRSIRTYASGLRNWAPKFP